MGSSYGFEPSPPGEPFGPPEPIATATRPAFPLGARFAGAAFVIGGFLLLGTLLLPRSVATVPANVVLVMVPIDLVVGVALLFGSRIARACAIAWAVLGAIVLVFTTFVAGSIVQGSIAIAFAAGLGLLLLGTPRAARLAVAASLLGLVSLGALGGLGFTAVKGWSLQLIYDDLPGTTVGGTKVAYRLTVPEGRGWQRFKDHIAHGRNADADLWLSDHARGAHVLVIAETIEEGSVREDDLADAISKIAGSRFTRYDELDRRPFPSNVKGALAVHSRGEAEGERFEKIVVVFIEGEHAYQVHAFADEAKFPALRRELEDIVRSFTPPRDPPPTTLPTWPLSVSPPDLPDPMFEKMDLRKLPAPFLDAKAREAAATRDYKAAIRFEHWAVTGGSGTVYKLACYYALSGDVNGAFYMLQRAAEEEGVDVSWASKDEDLDALRSDARWPTLVTYLKKTRRYWTSSGLKQTRVVLPKGYVASKPIPVLVGLHGYGSTPDDFADASYQPFADKLSVAFVGVSGTVPIGPHRFKWAEVLEEDQAQVRGALESLRDRLTIAEGKVVLIGFSQGAQTAAELTSHFPGRYTGAIVMSPGTGSMRGLASSTFAPQVSEARFVITVGAEEAKGNVEMAAEDARVLRSAGAEVRHQAYVGVRKHAFPPDFDEALPGWVRFVLKQEAKR